MHISLLYLAQPFSGNIVVYNAVFLVQFAEVAYGGFVQHRHFQGHETGLAIWPKEHAAYSACWTYSDLLAFHIT